MTFQIPLRGGVIPIPDSYLNYDAKGCVKRPDFTQFIKEHHPDRLNEHYLYLYEQHLYFQKLSKHTGVKGLFEGCSFDKNGGFDNMTSTNWILEESDIINGVYIELPTDQIKVDISLLDRSDRGILYNENQYMMTHHLNRIAEYWEANMHKVPFIN